MKPRGTILLLGIACLVLMLVALPFMEARGEQVARPAKPIELKISHTQPATGGIHVDVFVPWVKMLEERTNGKVKGIIYPSNTLSPEMETLDAVLAGSIDIAYSYGGRPPGRLPLSTVVELPMAPWSDTSKPSSCQSYVLMKLLNGGYLVPEWKGFKVLCLFGLDPNQIHTSKVPIRRMEDLNGLKINAPTVILSNAMSVLGSSPVILPITDFYISVQKGIVDGTFLSLTAFRSFRMDEVCKYHTICGFNGGIFYIVMSQKKWDSLPADVQKAMEGVTGDWMSQFCAKVEDKTSVKTLDYLKTAPGHEVIYLSAAERERWGKAVAPVWDKWVADNEAKGLPARKVLDAALKFTKEWKE